MLLCDIFIITCNSLSHLISHQTFFLSSKKRETITASSSCPHPDIQKASIRRSLFITTDATSLLSLTSQLPCLFHYAFLVSRSTAPTYSFRSTLSLSLTLRLPQFKLDLFISISAIKYRLARRPKTATYMIPRYLCSS